jgi:hypothetical protein
MCENEYLIKAWDNSQIRCIQLSSTFFATCTFSTFGQSSHSDYACHIFYCVLFCLSSTYVSSSSCLDVRRIFYSVSTCTSHLLLSSTRVAAPSCFSLQRMLHLLPLSQCLLFSFQSACAKSSNLSVCVSLLLLLHNVRCIVFSKYKCVASYTCTPSTRDAKRETDAVAIVLRVWKYT